MPRDTFKHLAIAEEVKKTIISGRIRKGDLLPSQNELISQYGVSLGTVRRAIDELTADGWVRAEKGRGMFAHIPDVIQGTSGKNLHTVGFAVIGPYSYYDAITQITLNSAMSVLRPAGKMVSYSVVPQDDQFSEHFNTFLDDVSGVMITGHVDERALQILQARKIKAVIVGHPMKASPLMDVFHWVSMDVEMAGYMAGQMLLSYGHQNVGFVYVLDNESYLGAQQGFRRACREHGAIRQESFHAFDPSAEIETTRAIACDRELTGLVVVGDMLSGRLIRNLERQGIRVPEDKSILSIGSLPRSSLQEPNLARIKYNCELMSQEAARILLEERAAVMHKMIAATFEPGQTLTVRGVHGETV